MFNFNQKQATDWREKVANLRTMREKVNEYSTNVPGLAPVLRKEFEAERDRVYPSLVAGAVGEFQGALKHYQTYQEIFDLYKKAENKRWNLPAIEAEKTAILARVKGIASAGNVTDKTGALRELYAEAMDGDLNRQRACLEVYQDLGELNLPGQTIHGAPLRHSVGEFTFDAKQRLGALRVTPDMIQSGQELDKALDDLLNAREQLRTVGQVVGDDPAVPLASGGEIGRNYRMLGTVNGELVIYPPDDWHVTGVVMGKLKENEVRNE